MKLQLLKSTFLAILFLCHTSVLAQDPHLDRLMQNIKAAILNGDCNQAQKDYNAWKDIARRTDSSIEAKIDNCFEPDEPPETEKTPISFGIKGGLNLATIRNSMIDNGFSATIKPGFHAGIFLNWRFTDVLGLQPEVLFSNQGFVVEGNTINFNYLHVPLMVKLYPGMGNFNIEFGPYFSFLMAVNPNSMEMKKDYDFFSETVAFNLSNLKNGKDIGVAAGLGYEFHSGFVIGARYSHGLSDLAKNLLWKNSVAAVSLGFKF